MTPWSAFVTMVVAALVVGLVLFAWQAREALLLAFAASIVAVILLAAAAPIERWTGLSRRWSLLIAGLVLLAMISGFFFLIGTELAAQLSQLRDALPQSLETLRQRYGIEIGQIGAAGGEPERSGPLRSLPDVVDVARSTIGNVMSAGTMLFNALASFIVVVVGGGGVQRKG